MIRHALCALALTGCATMFAGGPDYVPVSTNPPGAWVYYNGQAVGKTPMLVALDRTRPAQIQIALEGFQQLVFQRAAYVNGWFFANILWVALIFPWVIDLVDGDWRHFDDSPIAIGLTPLAGGPPPAQYPPVPQYPVQP